MRKRNFILSTSKDKRERNQAACICTFMDSNAPNSICPLTCSVCHACRQIKQLKAQMEAMQRQQPMQAHPLQPMPQHSGGHGMQMMQPMSRSSPSGGMGGLQAPGPGHMVRHRVQFTTHFNDSMVLTI